MVAFDYSKRLEPIIIFYAKQYNLVVLDLLSDVKGIERKMSESIIYIEVHFKNCYRMVLESLITPLVAERKPWEMFFLGIFYSTIAMFLGLWIFYDHASLVMVFLTSLACIPLLHSTLRKEEANEDHKKEIVLLKGHSRMICFLLFLFLGFIISFSAWYIFLPSHLTETMFSTQTKTISATNPQISDSISVQTFIGIGALRITGELTNNQLFWRIFGNNMKVLMFCVLFSLFYGAGAIFILTWEASVISTAIGNFIRTNLAPVTGLAFFNIFSIGVLRYMTHGVFELIAYFIAALAGGIISVALVRHRGTKQFKHILLDSMDLVFLAIAFLGLAAFTEVYITPVLF